MRTIADTNVLASAAGGNEFAQQALEMAGYYETATPAMGAIALDVAEELFEEFKSEIEDASPIQNQVEQISPFIDNPDEKHRKKGEAA